MMLAILIGVALISVNSNSQVNEYVTVKVRVGNIMNSVLATGHIDAIRRVDVGAQASGQVKSLYVKQGDYVVKGKMIASIDDVPQRNALRNAEATLEGAKASLQATQAKLKRAELRFKRQKAMLKENASSRQDFEAAEEELISCRSELMSNKAQLLKAQIDVDNKRVKLGYTHVLAPMNGTVIALVTLQGQTVNSSQSTPTIIKLAQLDVMTVKVKISEADITRVTSGQTVHFTIFSEPDKHYEATLKNIELAPESLMKDGSSDRNSSSESASHNGSVYYNALLEVPNPDNRLRIGMNAEVSLITSEAKNTLLVPRQAVHTVDGNAHQVQVLTQDHKLESLAVKTGITNSVDVQILEGLSAGDVVVLSQTDDEASRQGQTL
ncbi:MULTISPECIES: efflux RND transporter periplasmic adaptor subunit [unclassified Pantoea]|uniref:efflux RND transporter periplasmic adaptor subunit n=1 Tax=unclassified Pantoea TaxID=2630326 RepID=UPI0023DBC9BA|nr:MULTISPECIES: efflux RND transporter periplasmic adaptor subunit [unclassified Pantoea]MDF2043822.1 efflux RND transporter periplasmic adaptor subunit [Pantoea sp. Cr_R14]MDF2069821.1 efflux RND transporter periplasmic adaptor subunit [Pantoea sp. Cr_R13]MDF2081424.1 efflux RND transporter periplasmic adaptor subunit [Pantoea sp. Cr_R21]